MGIDWLRLRSSREYLGRIIAWGNAKFGIEPEPARGVHFYSSRLRWPSGMQIWYDDGDAVNAPVDHITVEIPGSCLASVDAPMRVQWVRELRHLGCGHCSRLDLAVDYKGFGLNLVGAMLASCEAGELVHSRRWKPIREFLGQELTGETLYIGSRGARGCGKYRRIYDKGLETKTAPAGQWQRIELETGGIVANACLTMLLQAEEAALDPDYQPILQCVDGVKVLPGWRKQLYALVVGSVDFREVTGRRDLKRRPRAAWWAEFIDGAATVRVQGKQRSRANLARSKRWIQNQVAPLIDSMALATGQDPREVYLQLTGEREHRRAVAIRDVVWEFYQEWKQQQPQGADAPGLLEQWRAPREPLDQVAPWRYAGPPWDGATGGIGAWRVSDADGDGPENPGTPVDGGD